MKEIQRYLTAILAISYFILSIKNSCMAQGVKITAHANELTYEWMYYENKNYNLKFSIAMDWKQSDILKVYKTLPHSEGDYQKFITNDPFLYLTKKIAFKLRELVKQYKLDEPQLLAKFVQNFTYTPNMGNYARYSFEFFLRSGDCSDMSIGLLSLYSALGYGVAFLKLPNHLAVGVCLDKTRGAHYHYQNRAYNYVETTSPSYKVGQIPEEYLKISATITPLNALNLWND